MRSKPGVTRRQFVSTAVTGIATLPLVARGAEPATAHPLCVFTKPFNSLSFDRLAEQVAKLGFDGIEAPIRKGGHIEPDAVPQRLPQLVEALRKQGLRVTVMTTDVNDPADPVTQRVLGTAAELGIERYRMKYFNYAPSLSVPEQLDQWRKQFAQLAELNRKLGIRAVYQNHAGNRHLGAALWDLARVLDGIDIDLIGVAYDIRHATVEGGQSWPTTFRMIRPHVDTVYVKDFRWVEGRPKNVPLGEGQVDPTFFKMLIDSGFNGPISLHEEYLDHRSPELVPQHWSAIERDVKTLRTWLTAAGAAER